LKEDFVEVHIVKEDGWYFARRIPPDGRYNACATKAGAFEDAKLNYPGLPVSDKTGEEDTLR
jgi:hypothetical protein